MPEIKQDIRGATFVVAANDSLHKNMADYVCDGTADNVEIQAAIDALPATGGCISLLEGTYTLANQVARAIDDVKFIGCGAGTIINWNGVNPVITAGVQNNWLFSHFATDAGGVDIAGAAQSAIRSVWIAGVRTDDPAAAAGGDAVITIAANNTPAAQKARADFVCGGANDDATIEAHVAAGVTIKLMVGDYIFGASLDILVSNFRLEGSGPGTVISGAIAVDYINIGDNATYVEAVTICDLSIDGTSQTSEYGIHLDGGSAANRCENISILHCFIHDTDDGAILTEHTHNSLFEGNYIEDAGWTGIYISVDSLYNRICDNYLHAPAADDGIRIDSSDNNVITGNILNDGGTRGVDLNNNSIYNTVTGNTFYDNSISIRMLSNSFHNTISGNTIYGGTSGISISGSEWNTVTGNNCFETTVGIALSDAHHNTITGNMCEGGSSGDESIMLLSASCHNTITGNTCNNNLKHGIYLLDASNNNTISGNTCQGNDRYGIFISASHNNNIIGNTCVENSQAADNTWANIQLTGADYNLLEANLCRMGALANQPNYGIELDADSDHNIVRDNDLHDSGLTGPINDLGLDTEFNNITFQFIQGSVFIDADGSAKGWEIDAADELAIALGQLPLELTQVVRIKIWGVALALTGAGIGMLLEINMNAGQDNEAYTAEAIAIANKVTRALNFAVNDVIVWIVDASDHANIGTLAGGDSLEVKVKFETLANGDIDTDAVFRAVEIEYVT